MSNRILMKALIVALCLPTAALAQQQEVERGAGTWEFSLGGGVKYMDGELLDFLSAGGASSRFTTGDNPGRLVPTAALRLGYNFSPSWGFSLGAEGATGGGVRYVSPFAAVTWTANLNARTSPFVTVGTQVTRITGQNSRVTHPSWGAHLGLGVRSMVSQKLALRLEGRMASEHYADLPLNKATYPLMATLGLSYFVGGRKPAPVYPTAAAPCQVCSVQQARVDTIVRTLVDTVVMHEPAPDQLVLRVQFRTGQSELLAKSRPVLDTIAMAIIHTPNSMWEVRGHTDDVGTSESNKQLAQARAQTVVDYLVSRGVPRGDLSANGFGEDRPVFSNASAYGRAQNRRVQLIRTPPPATGEPVQ